MQNVMLTILLFFVKVHIEFLDAGDVIKIEGPPTDSDQAREILEEQAKELMTKMDFTEINVDAKYHKHIIGKGGSTGKFIRIILSSAPREIAVSIFIGTVNSLGIVTWIS